MLPPSTFGWCGAGHSYLGYCGPMPCLGEHAEDTDCWGTASILNRPLPVYPIDEVRTESGPVHSSDDQDLLESLMRHLLPTPVVSPPKVSPVPSEHEQFIQRLMGKEPPLRPLLPDRTNLMDMEILLQNLLPIGPLVEEHRPLAVSCQVSTVVCFSCGESGHLASRCPALDDMFPFLPPGWLVDWTDDGFVIRGGGHSPGSVIMMDPRFLLLVTMFLI